MRTYSVTEADSHFKEMLDHVRSGETVIVTENGTAIAELHPRKSTRAADLQKLKEDLAAFRRQAMPVTSDEISEWRREGQKG